MFNRLIIVACFCLSLFACTSIEYKQKNDWIPEGYSETQIDSTTFEVRYQTYRSGYHFDKLKHLALKRAAEIALRHNKNFFLMIDEARETKKGVMTIPEQKNRSLVRADRDLPPKEIETIIPAHNKEYLIQEITLTIRLLDTQQENAFDSNLLAI